MAQHVWEIMDDRLFQAGLLGWTILNSDVKPDTVVCCTVLSEVPGLLIGTLHVEFPFEDKEELPDMARLENIVALAVSEIKDGRKVAVVCNAGINRSCFVCGLILRRMDCANPLDVMHSRHPECLTNKTFADYLAT